MFVILSYDVNSKRVGKVLKICRKYLHHVHRSVFEGEITEAKLNRLERELEHAVNVKHDSIKVYRMPSPHVVTKDELGKSELFDRIV